MDIASLREDPRFAELIAKHFGGAKDQDGEKAKGAPAAEASKAGGDKKTDG